MLTANNRRARNCSVHCGPILRATGISRPLTTVFLQLPLTIVQRTYVPCLKPAGDTVEVESVVTDTPGCVAFFARRRDLVSLTIDAKIHDMIPADRAVVYDDIPGPESDSIPLLDLEPFLVVFLYHGASRGVYVHISHV